MNQLFRDVMAENGKPLPSARRAEDFNEFSAVLADEWAKGRV